MFDGKSLCTDCTVLSTRMGLEFEDGSLASPEKGVYVHHLYAFDVSKAGVVTSLPCDFETVNKTGPPFDPMIPISPFAVQGEDNGDAAILYTTTDGKFDSGFYIGANDKFLINSDLVNYNAEAKQVYLTIDFEYVPGKAGLDAFPNLLSVVGCKFSEPKISTAGPAETMSRKFPILVDGSILWSSKIHSGCLLRANTLLGGHLHSGGDKMVMYLNDKEICTSAPTYDDKEVITSMASCDKPIKVQKGDSISIKSVYDITKHPMLVS
jgi:hypothetical protein